MGASTQLFCLTSVGAYLSKDTRSRITQTTANEAEHILYVCLIHIYCLFAHINFSSICSPIYRRTRVRLCVLMFHQ